MINLKYFFLLVIAMKANILSVLINPAQELRNMPWTLHTIIRSSKENSSHLNQFIQISAKKHIRLPLPTLFSITPLFQHDDRPHPMAGGFVGSAHFIFSIRPLLSILGFRIVACASLTSEVMIV